MKLTPEQIEKIEAFLTSQENGPAAYGKKSKAYCANVGAFIRTLIGASLIRGRKAKIDYDLAREMRAAGVSDVNIGKHFGVCSEAVRLALGNRRDARPTVEDFLASRRAAQ